MQQSGLFLFVKVSIEEKFKCVMSNDNHDGARPDHPDVFLKNNCCRPDVTVTQTNENIS